MVYQTRYVISLRYNMLLKIVTNNSCILLFFNNILHHIKTLADFILLLSPQNKLNYHYTLHQELYLCIATIIVKSKCDSSDII